jgi:hypothetical protein
MGQQETMKETSSSAVRRIVVVLAVAALMAATMLAMAAPVFAGDKGGNNFGGPGRGGGFGNDSDIKSSGHDANGVCIRNPHTVRLGGC